MTPKRAARNAHIAWLRSMQGARCRLPLGSIYSSLSKNNIGHRTSSATMVCPRAVGVAIVLCLMATSASPALQILVAIAVCHGVQASEGCHTLTVDLCMAALSVRQSHDATCSTTCTGSLVQSNRILQPQNIVLSRNPPAPVPGSSLPSCSLGG